MPRKLQPPRCMPWDILRICQDFCPLCKEFDDGSISKLCDFSGNRVLNYDRQNISYVEHFYYEDIFYLNLGLGVTVHRYQMMSGFISVGNFDLKREAQIIGMRETRTTEGLSRRFGFVIRWKYSVWRPVWKRTSWWNDNLVNSCPRHHYPQD